MIVTLSLILNFFNFFYIVHGIIDAPTSYVYRSDGGDRGYSRSFSSGSDNEYRKVIVKRYEMPLTVTSYSTYITHPVSSNDYKNNLIAKANPYSDNWSNKVYYGSGAPVGSYPEDRIYEEYKDDNDGYDEGYWSNEDEKDMEKYSSKLVYEGRGEREKFFPYDDWFGKAYYSNGFDEENYF